MAHPLFLRENGHVGQQRPSIAGDMGFGEKNTEAFEEISTIPVVLEDMAAFYTADNDVV